MLDPNGRVIMISGANRGIGRAVAAVLRDKGYTLSLGARRPEALDGFLAAGDTETAMGHAFEAGDAASAAAWVAATVARFGRLDGVVANAGVLHEFTVEDEDETGLDEMWEVNVKGPLRLIRAAFPHLKRSGSGRIVNVVSLSGKRVRGAAIAGYAMSKHAALALTHGARYSGWRHGIRAAAICPGYVRSDMTAAVEEVPGDDMVQPQSVGEIAAMLLAMPNTASITEVPVNCVLEHTF